MGSRMLLGGEEGRPGRGAAGARAREQSWDDRWAVGGRLFGLFDFGQGSCRQQELLKCIWESAAGVFTVQNDAEMVHGEVKRDTKITFYLKEDLSEFSEE